MTDTITRTTLSRAASHLAGSALIAAGLLVGTARLAAADEGEFHHGPDTCQSGYVWRNAFDGDSVCVTPKTRDRAAVDNAEAAARREPNGGAFGPNTCRSGYVWRVARPDDLVCVTPETRDQVAADNAHANERYQASAPGKHTIVLEEGKSLLRRSDKYFPDTCNPGGPSAIFDPKVKEVGWVQIEIDGAPCFAAVNQVAVRPGTAALDRIPAKIINRAVLTYDERPSQGCEASAGPDPSCWRSGGGAPEDKPNGCVVVRIPLVDWTRAEPTGMVPYVTHPTGHPTVTRLGAREWDVTEPYSWQTDPKTIPLQVPNAPPVQAGFGFLLSGGPSLDQLAAEDNTSCMSILSNIRVRVTYTVPPGSDEPFRAPR